MKRRNATVAVVAALLVWSGAARADDNVGCGWGTQLWAGNNGFIVQMLATVTNGTSGSQPFGITSQTSGCTRGGIITADARLSMFAGANIDSLARDMAVGEGENLETLAYLMAIEEPNRHAFYRLTKQNFAVIFSSEETTAGDMLTAIRGLMAEDPELQHYVES